MKKVIKIHYRLLYMLLFGRTLENPKRNKSDLVIELVAYAAKCSKLLKVLQKRNKLVEVHGPFDVGDGYKLLFIPSVRVYYLHIFVPGPVS